MALANALILIPALAFVLIALWLQRWPRVAAGVSIGATALTWLGATVLLAVELQTQVARTSTLVWLQVGRYFRLTLGTLLDPLAASMLFIVTLVSLLVQIYSTGYMKGDDAYGRYFAYLSFFTATMLGLVLSSNLFQMYVFYELVGLASFLLIGFWFTKEEAILAAKKAFVTTRIGDFGLLLGILLLWSTVGTLDFGSLGQTLYAGRTLVGLPLNPKVIPIAALLVFAGAVGKSAQFPLHVWLPDAMAGPTPASALIHAATMVAAGVYLVARVYPLFTAPVAGTVPLTVVAWIGGFTALFAATIAVAQDDIKKVLAYSTISQLGLMMMGLGVAGYTAGIFHLFTHAFFKALLFLGAGSVIIGAHHRQDMWELGGLRRKMPVTAATFVIGALALSGIPPLAGFFSKDEILLAAYTHKQFLLFAMGLATSLLTAFYMFRLIFVTFGGSTAAERLGSGPEAGENGPAMTVPLVILAFFAVTGGFVGLPGLAKGISAFLTYGQEGAAPFSVLVAILATGVGLLGIWGAWSIYGRRRPEVEPLAAQLGGVWTGAKNKWYVDEFYAACGTVLVEGLSTSLAWFDRQVVNGIVDGVGVAIRGAGDWLRKLQSGWVQRYALLIVSAIFGAFVIWLLARSGLTGLGGIR